MSEFDIRILVLCIIVFTLLVGVMSALLIIIYRQSVALIKAGVRDDKIKAEYDKYTQSKIKNKAFNIINIMASILVGVLLIGIIGFTIYLNVGKDDKVGNTPVVKTINSSSMASKNARNAYLNENNLDNQVGLDDLIVLEKLPNESEIKRYDIVMYKNPDDGKLVLHRVVDIIDGSTNDGTKLFVTQGDAVEYPDAHYVRYADMRGIYRGKHVKGLGSFVKFINSPAGYLCIIFAFFVVLSLPIIEFRINKIKINRLKSIDYIDEKGMKNEDKVA